MDLHVSGFYLALLATFVAGDTLSCRKGFTCVPISECFIENDGDDDIYYPCLSGICCPDKDANRIIPRTTQFPAECGLVELEDKVTGGVTAAPGQFPWMALLGYRHKEIDITQFLCGGSLISSRFVLTAAHCTNLPTLELQVVRFGEQNLSKNPDCEVLDKSKICADPHVEVAVEKVTPHEKFNSVTLKNDIALVKLKKKVGFTEYIQPICLPFDIALRPNMFFEKKFTVSGWGKTSSENLGGSNSLQYASVTVWTKNKCNLSVPPEVRPINDKQICANGRKTEDACKGDSGGPIFNATVRNNALRTYQIGVVSFSSALVCGNADLPTIYTRVDTYLNWITQNAK